MTMPTQPTQQAALQDALLKAFGDTADSLSFNRQGTLAPGQRQALLAQARRDRVASLGAAIVAIGLLVTVVALAMIRPSDGLVICMVITGFVVLLSPAFIYLMLQRSRRLEAEVKDGKVESVEGPIKKWESGGERSGGIQHHFTLGQKTFEVSGKVYSAQVDGWHYRLYYLPQSNRVVAIEPLLTPNTLANNQADS